MVSAMTLDKDTYVAGEPMVISDVAENSFLVIYNLDTEQYFFDSQTPYSPEWNPSDIFYFPDYPPYRYAIMQIAGYTACSTIPLTYEECKAQTEFIDEVIITINPVPSSGGGDGGGDPVLDEERAIVRVRAAFGRPCPLPHRTRPQRIANRTAVHAHARRRYRDFAIPDDARRQVRTQAHAHSGSDSDGSRWVRLRIYRELCAPSHRRHVRRHQSQRQRSRTVSSD